MDRWYKHTFNPLLKKYALEDEEIEKFTIRIEEEMSKRGILHHRVGHGWTAEAIHINTTGWKSSAIDMKEEFEFCNEESRNLMEYHANYAILISRALSYLANGDVIMAEEEFDKLCYFIQSNEETFQSGLDVYRVIEVATKYTGCNRS